MDNNNLYLLFFFLFYFVFYLAFLFLHSLGKNLFELLSFVATRRNVAIQINIFNPLLFLFYVLYRSLGEENSIYNLLRERVEEKQQHTNCMKKNLLVEVI